jgi:hypothetical protein
VNINEAFPSKYLKASDLRGSTPIVTIDHVTVEEVGKARDRKPVAYFVGKEKGLVLNKTNATKIGQITGSAETDEWVGAKIMLYTTETEFQGESVETIRIKPVPAARSQGARPAPTPAPEPPPAPSAPLADMDDSDIPF